MSLKENVEVIKEELSAEEQFFEKAVVTEKFLKKYKKVIYAGLGIIVVAMLVKVGFDIKEQNRIEAANKALAVLQKNPSSTQAQQTLQSNSPKLYALWLYAQSIKKDDVKSLNDIASKKLPIISDAASYQVASLQADIAKLQQYTLKQNSIYKELATLEIGVEKLHKNQITQAKEEFLQVKTAPLSTIAKTLIHYGVK